MKKHMDNEEYVKLADIIKVIELSKGSLRDVLLNCKLDGIKSTAKKLTKYHCIDWQPGIRPPEEYKRYLCRYTVEGHNYIGCLDYLNYDNGPHWITHGAKAFIIEWADVSSDTEVCL